MSPLRFLCPILALLILPGCRDETRFSRAFFSSPGATDPTSADPQEGLRRLINGAQQEVLFCMFRFDLASIANALIEAHKRGVAVHVFTDQDCKLAPAPSEYRRLMQSGISVTCDASIFNSAMHHKFIEVDRSVVWTGDWNAHQSDTFKAHHSAIQVRSPELAHIYRQLFKHMTTAQYRDGLGAYPSLADRSCRAPNGVEFTVHHTPEVSGSEVVATALAQAQEEILIAHCYLGDRWVIKELLHAARRGVRVRGVYNTASSGYDRSLALQGLDIREAAPTFLGSKYFVIDGQDLITGSWNCSGNHPDHDNIVEVRGDQDLCREFMSNFEALFATAKPFFNVPQESRILDRSSQGSLPPTLDAEVIYQDQGGTAAVRGFRMTRKNTKIGEKQKALLEIDAGDLDPDSQWSVDLWVAPCYHKGGEYLERWNRPLPIQRNRTGNTAPLYEFTFAWPGKGNWRIYARVVRVLRASGARRIVGMYSAPFVESIR